MTAFYQQRRQTERVELVETHNIALSLERLRKDNSNIAWRRALYHALSMSYATDRAELEKIRVALDLP
jgi:hypothetical protein